jgi:hypothetical protein
MEQSDPAASAAIPDFIPVAVRPRHDGWTPDKQARFIQALAATACVEEAARSVGMSARSARDLRTRRDAGLLRVAWDAAVASGIAWVEEAAMARAIHGVKNPIFYKGEQVGERVTFNERITATLLRAHAPQRYGAWRDKLIVEQNHPDSDAMIYHEALRRLVSDCVRDAIGEPRKQHPPLLRESSADDPEAEANRARRKEEMERSIREDEWNRFEAQLDRERAEWQAAADAERARFEAESRAELERLQAAHAAALEAAAPATEAEGQAGSAGGLDGSSGSSAADGQLVREHELDSSRRPAEPAQPGAGGCGLRQQAADSPRRPAGPAQPVATDGVAPPAPDEAPKDLSVPPPDAPSRNTSLSPRVHRLNMDHHPPGRGRCP